MADKPVEPPSIGKGFVDKLEAKEIGIGPAFVEKLEANDESVVASLRKRAGTATEGLKAASTATLSRLSSAASEVVPAVEGTFAAAASWVMGDGGHDGSLHNAVARLRVKDLLVPGQEVVFVETHDSVAKLEVLLREQHIHSVPVWNPPAKRWEGVVDTGDLVVWASVKFPKSQLDAWTTFRQEAEFGAQHVADIVNVSQRNRFCATTPETEALTVLEAFRDLDIHRVFVRRGEHELLGVLTHTDILRFLNQASFALKASRVGDLVRAHSVVTCYEEELVLSAFKLMWASKTSAVCVVNATGQATSCLTSYDVVVKADSVISTLFKPVKSFVGRDTANAPVTFVSVRPQNTFQEVLEKMTATKVSHIFVVDDDGCPTAVLTVKDLLHVFLPKGTFEL